MININKKEDKTKIKTAVMSFVCLECSWEMTAEFPENVNIKEVECINCSGTNLITSSEAYNRFDIVYCHCCDTQTYVIDSSYICRNCGREIEEEEEIV
jgi:DNA-directed RNA polymerase subunit RPC12/RpoP